MSYWENAADRILRLDERIRSLGIVDSKYRMIISKTREGISSLTPLDVDRNFMSIVPPIIVEGLRRLEEHCGLLQIMTVRYRKVLLAIYSDGLYVVVLSFEPSIETPFMNKLAEELRRIIH